MEWIRLSAGYVSIKSSEKCHFWPIVFFSLNFFIITNMVYSSPWSWLGKGKTLEWNLQSLNENVLTASSATSYPMFVLAKTELPPYP